MPKKPKEEKLPPGVRKRNGRYTYRYSVEVVKDGKRTRKQKETPAYDTAKEAYDAGILIEADKLQGRLVDPKNVTLEAWRERWLEDYQIEREPRKRTVKNRKNALVSFSRFIGDQTRMRDITGDDCQRWLNNLKKIGRKQGTIREYQAAARIFFSDAVRKSVIADDPMSSTILPAFKQTLAQIESGELDIPKFLEKKELKHFLNIIRFRGKPQEHEFFTTLGYTGLRINELTALKDTDFDEKERTLSITKTLSIIGGLRNYTLGPPKNDTSIRIVTIGKTVIDAIKRQLAWRDRRIADGEALHDAGFIFWSESHPGYPICCYTLEHHFTKYLQLAGLPDTLTPHSLRHTHVSLLAEGGEDLAVIQERLGHKNDDITRRIYLHVTKERKKLTPDRFEKIMNS